MQYIVGHIVLYVHSSKYYNISIFRYIVSPLLRIKPILVLMHTNNNSLGSSNSSYIIPSHHSIHYHHSILYFNDKDILSRCVTDKLQHVSY